MIRVTLFALTLSLPLLAVADPAKPAPKEDYPACIDKCTDAAKSCMGACPQGGSQEANDCRGACSDTLFKCNRMCQSKM